MAGKSKFTIVAKIVGDASDFVRAADRGLREVRKKGAKTARSIGQDFRKRLRGGIAGAGKALASGIGVSAGQSIGAAFGEALDNVRDFETKLQDVGVQAQFTAGQTQALGDDIAATSEKLKVSQDVLIAAAAALVDVEGGSADLTQKTAILGKTAAALTSNIEKQGPQAEDLAKIWNALNKAFFDGAGTASDMEAALSAAIEAGQRGSVPLSKMGIVLADVAAGFATVGDKGKLGVAQLTAALEATVGAGFGTAEKAATGLQGAVDGLANRAKKLKKLGVRVFDRRGERRNINDILDDLGKAREKFLAKGKDFESALFKAVGRSEAKKFLITLLDQRDAFTSITEAAAESDAVGRDFAKNAQSDVGQLNKATVSLDNAMREAFSPERIQAMNAALRVAFGLASDLIGAIEGIGEGLASFIADPTASTVKQAQRLAAELRPDIAAEQKLAAELEALGRGEIAPAQRRRVARFGAEGVAPEVAAQRLSAREAERLGLVSGGEVNVEKLAEALKAAAFAEGRGGFSIEELKSAVAVLQSATTGPALRGEATVAEALQGAVSPLAGILATAARGQQQAQENFQGAVSPLASLLATQNRLLGQVVDNTNQGPGSSRGSRPAAGRPSLPRGER